MDYDSLMHRFCNLFFFCSLMGASEHFLMSYFILNGSYYLYAFSWECLFVCLGWSVCSLNYILMLCCSTKMLNPTTLRTYGRSRTGNMPARFMRGKSPEVSFSMPVLTWVVPCSVALLRLPWREDTFKSNKFGPSRPEILLICYLLVE